jgi:hypothetical protein
MIRELHEKTGYPLSWLLRWFSRESLHDMATGQLNDTHIAALVEAINESIELGFTAPPG